MRKRIRRKIKIVCQSLIACGVLLSFFACPFISFSASLSPSDIWVDGRRNLSSATFYYRYNSSQSFSFTPAVLSYNSNYWFYARGSWSAPFGSNISDAYFMWTTNDDSLLLSGSVYVFEFLLFFNDNMNNPQQIDLSSLSFCPFSGTSSDDPAIMFPVGWKASAYSISPTSALARFAVPITPESSLSASLFEPSLNGYEVSSWAFYDTNGNNWKPYSMDSNGLLHQHVVRISQASVKRYTAEEYYNGIISNKLDNIGEKIDTNTGLIISSVEQQTLRLQASIQNSTNSINANIEEQTDRILSGDNFGNFDTNGLQAAEAVVTDPMKNSIARVAALSPSLPSLDLSRFDNIFPYAGKIVQSLYTYSQFVMFVTTVYLFWTLIHMTLRGLL